LAFRCFVPSGAGSMGSLLASVFVLAWLGCGLKSTRR
jgi:hypothetical protein